MSLALYNKKRRFNETPEPAGKERSSKSGLRFVIQKHDASHVHYDFRLEMDGVLKSWAIPKGPSLDPANKRLAMMVEDHPYDYRSFEGVIPEGNYGAGTVIVWDEGTYEPLNAEGLSRREQEKLLLQQLHSGDIKLNLHGEKVRGAFALFHMKTREENAWILVKKKDEFATTKDIAKEEASVKSGKTLVDVAQENGTTVHHPEAHKKSRTKSKSAAPAKSKSKPAAKKAAAKKSGTSKKKRPSVKQLAGESFKLAKKTPMPQDVVPMLATLVDEAFDDDQWIFEIKWDGYRALSYCNGNSVELISRNLTPFTERYAPVTEALQKQKLKAVLDGEIVAVNEKGLADFQSLQNWQNTPVHLQYYVFDLLWLEGYDLTRVPLLERKRILKEVLPQDDAFIKYSDHVSGNGKQFFEGAVWQGIEGIMAKKSNSGYLLNKRSEDWLKIKVSLRQEVVIGGYTEPRRSRKYFGSLLLGLYKDKELVYVGHTGSGFNQKSLETVYKKMQPLITDDCPFDQRPKTNAPATWIKPELVCEIKFAEWTRDGIARQAIFMGLREDKKPKDVHQEKAADVDEVKTDAVKENAAERKSKSDKSATVKKKAAKKTALKKAASTTKKSAHKSSATKKPATGKTKKTSNDPALQIDPAEGAQQQIVLDGENLKLTNLDKLYWKKEGFTKGDMVNYYLKMAEYMLPHMMDRPQSLHRHPNGISGASFFQKDQKGKPPAWIKTHDDYSESTGKNVTYLVCSNEATLVYMANLGCIEMHPWHSRVQSPLRPDWCLIDLDPSDKNSFDQVMEVAKVVKEVLDSIGADAYIKTSGSTGLHIYLPLGAQYDYEQSKQFAQLIVTMVHQQMPELTSLERSPSKRKTKIYLDYLQNRETQTAAAPYSLRPKPGMPVSTPLDWSELKKGLTPTTWNALNIFDRVRSEGDLFAPVLGKGIDLQQLLSKLAAQTGA